MKVSKTGNSKSVLAAVKARVNCLDDRYVKVKLTGFDDKKAIFEVTDDLLVKLPLTAKTLKSVSVGSVYFLQLSTGELTTEPPKEEDLKKPQVATSPRAGSPLSADQLRSSVL